MKIFQIILIALVASTAESNADAAKNISVTDSDKQDSKTVTSNTAENNDGTNRKTKTNITDYFERKGTSNAAENNGDAKPKGQKIIRGAENNGGTNPKPKVQTLITNYFNSNGGKYYVADKSCPKGNEIRTKKACEDAAKYLQSRYQKTNDITYRYQRITNDDTYRPGGCFLDVTRGGSTGGVYFNENLDGVMGDQFNLTIKAVCEKKVSLRSAENNGGTKPKVKVQTLITRYFQSNAEQQGNGSKTLAIAGVSCAAALALLIVAIKLSKKKSAEVEEDHEEEI